MTRRVRLLAAAAAVLSIAAAPGTWRHPDGKPADGVAEDISLSDSGRIILAPASREILPGEEKVTAPPLLWSVGVDLKGSVFIGGGARAQVFRVDRKGKPESIFDVDDLGVRALATDVAGDVFVATFPNGRVYRVSAEGKAEVYFDAEERYLWAMATDAFDRLYVATGERGVVYVVTGRGEGRAFFDSDEAHITSLATDPSGRLIAGSAGRGLLYRLDNEGRPEVILDSRLDEIGALAVGSDGTVYAAALTEPGPSRPRRPGDRSDEVTIEVTPAAGDGILEEATEQKQKLVIDLGEFLPSPVEGKARPASQVFRVLPGRTPVVAWASATERAYSLTLDPRGHLLVGTGPAGNLYRLEPDGSVTLVRRFPASQITSMTTAPDGKTYVLTSNPGRAHVLDAAPAASGRYLSPVRDAGAVATWGTLRFDADVPAGTRIEVSARVGNSPAPDETWSSWSAPLSSPDGGPLKLPAAHYIQWRAELSRLKTEATPILRNVILTYLPENLAPTVKGVSVSEPGAPKPPAPSAAQNKDPAAEGTAPAKEAAGGGVKALWLTWTSSDPDGDTLRHTISVKRPEEADWSVLARDVKEPPYEIDPGALPEGRYIVQVEADDAGVNGAERALSAEGRSEPFGVDRTRPAIEPEPPEEAGGTLNLAFSVHEAGSIVSHAEWGTEADGPWTAVAPRDGIADSRNESFLIRIPTAGAPRRIFLRAEDAAGNLAALEVVLSRR